MKITTFSISLLFFSFSLLAQDSLNMERLGQWNPPNMPDRFGVIYNDIWGYTADDGSEYAIMGNADSIMFINITDPYNPVRKFGYDGGNSVIWRDFKTFGDYAYGVCDSCNEGMHIFDMSALPNGQVEHVLTTTSFFSRAHNIYIDTLSQRLYAAGTNTVDQGLVVLDITNPEVPVLIDNIRFDAEIGNFSLDTYVHDLYVQNDTAYCSHGNFGYYIWDMIDLNDIDLLGSYNSPGYNHSSWIDDTGSYAYYAEEVPSGRPLALVNLENIHVNNQNITIDSLFKDPISNQASNPTPHNPFVKGDKLYISYYEDGLKVYDITDPAQPKLDGYYDVFPQNGTSYNGTEGTWGAYPYFDSGVVVVSDDINGLNILKLQDCANPITYYRDFDEDGFGDPERGVNSCSVPAGYVLDNSDCDDSDASGTFPNTYYLDSDNDGFGDPLFSIMACSVPVGYSVLNTDCDDSKATVNPEFPEICDGIDNNCNGQIDGDDPMLTTIDWYEDIDGDGYGTTNDIINQCSQPDGYAPFDMDCDDSNPNIYPNNTEICDGVDNDCNNITDEDCTSDCDGVNLIINNITQSTYRAKNTIDSDNITLTSGQDVMYFAGQNINLNENFEVASGAEFLAAIADCDLVTSTIITISPENINDIIKTVEGTEVSITFNNTHMVDKSGNIQIIENKEQLVNYLKMHYFNSFKFKVD